jgi:PAS domain S-box-containing protein
MKKRILVIDDDVIILSSLHRELEAAGYDAETESRGDFALEKLRADVYDLVITDLVIDEVDGIRILQELKALCPETACIVLTGFGDADTIITALRYKADDFITKPCETEELLFRVKEAIEKKEMARELRLKNTEVERYRKRLELAVKGAGIGFWEWHIPSGSTYYSKSWAEALGYAEGDLEPDIKTWYEMIHPEDSAAVIEQSRRHIMGEIDHYDAEYRMKTKSGGFIWVHEIGDIVERDDNDEPLKASGVQLVIDSRKRNEEALKKALEEKNILIKEIHHRVKNNLAIIASLINLQSVYLKDEGSSKIFAELKNRIKSIALIHEKLYASSDLAHVNVKEYIQDLVDNLFYTMTLPLSGIRKSVQADNFSMNIDQLIPLGMILTELITNSIKYAFTSLPDGEAPELKVVFKVENNNCRLTVGDNGCGFSSGAHPVTSSLGLRLVKSLTEQLKGEGSFVFDKGTVYVLDFIAEN